MKNVLTWTYNLLSPKRTADLAEDGDALEGRPQSKCSHDLPSTKQANQMSASASNGHPTPPPANITKPFNYFLLLLLHLNSPLENLQMTQMYSRHALYILRG